MNRIFPALFLVLALLIGAAGFAIWSLTGTSSGRSLIKSEVEGRLGKALNGTATIGDIGPGLPGHLDIRDIRLRDSEGEWLYVSALEAKWSPLALIGGNIEFSSLAIGGGRFNRFPVMPEKDEDKDSPPKAFVIPKSLPSVLVEDFSLRDFSFQIPGRDAAPILAADGTLRIGGKSILLELDAATNTNTDRLIASIRRDEASDRLTVDLALDALPGGVISSFAGTTEPIDVNASGAGPVNDFALAFDANAPDFALAKGELRGNFYKSGSNLTLNVRPSGRLDSLRASVGETIDVDAHIDSSPDGMTITLAQLASDAASIDGRIGWQNRRDQINGAQATLNIAPGPLAPELVGTLLGGAATIDAKISRSGNTYSIIGDLSSANIVAALTNGETDLVGLATGSLTARLQTIDQMPLPISKGVTTSTSFRFDETNGLSLSDLIANFADGAEFNGNAAYNPANSEIRFQGNFDGSPAALARLQDQLDFSRPVNGSIEIAGTTDDLTLIADFSVPVSMMGETQLPAADVTAKFSNLPNAPNGEISTKTSKGGALKADIRTGRDGVIRVPNLAGTGPNIALSGSGAFDPETRTGNLALDVTALPGAEPWPGLPMQGGLAITANADGKTYALDANTKGGKFQFLNNSVSGLQLTAKGPVDAVAIKMALGEFASDGSQKVANLSANALFSSASQTLTVNEFAASLLNEEARLQSTLKIGLEDGVSFDGLDARYGPTGIIKGNGAFASKRWTASISADNFAIPSASAKVNAGLDIDTDRDRVAFGTFKAIPVFAEDADLFISGRFDWDGNALRIIDDGTTEALDLDLVLPIRLERSSDALSVKAEGKLEGTVLYDGKLEVVALFLPSVLQTLEGNINANVSLAGDLSKPTINGELKIVDGAYTELSSGLSLANMTADARAVITGGEGEISFNAGANGSGDGAQTILADGILKFQDKLDIAANLTLASANFSAGPVDSMQVSGGLKVVGTSDTMSATGAFEIEELNASAANPPPSGLTPIEVIWVKENGELEERAPAAPAPPINLDLVIKSPGKMFVRGRGLESEWEADLRVTGSAAEPVVLGDLSLKRGILDFAGRRFNVSTGDIAFDRVARNNPALDIQANYSTPEDLTATIAIEGRAQSPSITLESSPSLPREDVMAVVLFGKQANQLSAFESLQVAQALAQLGGVGPFGGGGGLTGSARESLGLDMLNIDLDSDTGASALTLGKYVADGLFVSATQNARGNQGAVRVEYEVTDQISLETQLRQDGDQTVSANWKKDF